MKEWITGRNPVLETLRHSRRQFFRLLIADGLQPDPRIDAAIKFVREKKLPVEKVNKLKLAPLAENHQGIALEVSAYPYSDLQSILAFSAEKQEPPFILLLDTLQNPQNFGTLLRSAKAFNVHGIIIPFRHTVEVTPAVVTASAGACEQTLIASMNLAQAIETLKKEGLWIIGLEGDPSATPIEQIKLNGPLGLVVGSEGEGMRELVRKSCDQLARLSMPGNFESLNAAVAGSIALYMASQKRL